MQEIGKKHTFYHGVDLVQLRYSKKFSKVKFEQDLEGTLCKLSNLMNLEKNY